MLCFIVAVSEVDTPCLLIRLLERYHIETVAIVIVPTFIYLASATYPMTAPAIQAELASFVIHVRTPCALFVCIVAILNSDCNNICHLWHILYSSSDRKGMSL